MLKGVLSSGPSKQWKKCQELIMDAKDDAAASEVNSVPKDEIDYNKAGTTLLQGAAARGLHKTVRALLQLGADPNLARKDGHTALSLAAEKGHSETVVVLVEGGARVNPPGVKDTENAAILLAAKEGKLEIVKYLASKGANVDVQDKDGKSALLKHLSCTALWHAVSENRREIAKVLLDAGANPDTPRKRDKVAPIHIATSKCLYDMIQILIDHKADTNAVCDGHKGERWKPLDIAKGKGDPQLLSLLGTKTGVIVKKKVRDPNALRSSSENAASSSSITREGSASSFSMDGARVSPVSASGSGFGSGLRTEITITEPETEEGDK